MIFCCSLLCTRLCASEQDLSLGCKWEGTRKHYQLERSLVLRAAWLGASYCSLVGLSTRTLWLQQFVTFAFRVVERNLKQLGGGGWRSFEQPENEVVLSRAFFMWFLFVLFRWGFLSFQSLTKMTLSLWYRSQTVRPLHHCCLLFRDIKKNMKESSSPCLIIWGPWGGDKYSRVHPECICQCGMRTEYGKTKKRRENCWFGCMLPWKWDGHVL